MKAASPSIRRTRSPSAGAPPQAGPSRHADRGTRAAFARASFLRHFPSRPAPLQSRVRACVQRGAVRRQRIVVALASFSVSVPGRTACCRIVRAAGSRMGMRRVMARACAPAQRPACERVARDYRRAAHARPVATADRILRGAHPNPTAGRSLRAHRRRRCACVRAARARRAPASRCDCRGSRRLAVHRQLFERRAASLRRRRERARHAARPARDATALPLIRAAIDAGVPVLAICRGMQELNVAYGGTLHQRLHATTGFDDRAARRSARAVRRPVIAVRAGLRRVVKPVRPTGWSKPSACAARARSRSACSGPEWRYAEQPLSRDIFAAFGAACRARMTHRIHAAGGAMPLPAASDVD